MVCSVPQGSVPGPRLFILYTADLTDTVRKHHVGINVYADDHRLSVQCRRDDMIPAADRFKRICQTLATGCWLTCSKCYSSSRLWHTSSINAYPVYCVTNCTGSTFLSECSTSWQWRFTGAFKMKRRSTWWTNASQSPMSPCSRQHLRSASRHFLTVRRFRRSTFGRRAFAVGCLMAWNSLPGQSPWSIALQL